MKIIRALVRAVAWLFAGGTLLTLVLVVTGGVLHPGSTSRLWASEFSGQEPIVHIYQIPAAEGAGSSRSGDLREAIGLTYRGYAGVLLAAVQTLVVAGCAVLTVRGTAFQRRAAHLALGAWAALWLGNAMWMWIATPTTATRVSAGIVALLFACTVLRAWMSWNRDGGDHHEAVPNFP